MERNSISKIIAHNIIMMDMSQVASGCCLHDGFELLFSGCFFHCHMCDVILRFDTQLLFSNFFPEKSHFIIECK